MKPCLPLRDLSSPTRASLAEPSPTAPLRSAPACIVWMERIRGRATAVSSLDMLLMVRDPQFIIAVAHGCMTKKQGTQPPKNRDTQPGVTRGPNSLSLGLLKTHGPETETETDPRKEQPKPPARTLRAPSEITSWTTPRSATLLPLPQFTKTSSSWASPLPCSSGSPPSCWPGPSRCVSSRPRSR